MMKFRFIMICLSLLISACSEPEIPGPSWCPCTTNPILYFTPSVVTLDDLSPFTQTISIANVDSVVSVYFELLIDTSLLNLESVEFLDPSEENSLFSNADYIQISDSTTTGVSDIIRLGVLGRATNYYGSATDGDIVRLTLIPKQLNFKTEIKFHNPIVYIYPIDSIQSSISNIGWINGSVKSFD